MTTDKGLKRESEKKAASPLPIQQSLVTAIALSDDEHASFIAEDLDPELFDPPLDEIVAACQKYRKQYGRPPGRGHIDDLLAPQLQNPKHRHHEAYKDIMVQMLRLHSNKEFNTAFLRDELATFKRAQAQRELITDTVFAYNNQEFEKVDDLFRQAPALLKKAGEPEFEPKALGDITLEPTRWLWHPYIPAGKLTVVTGLPESGKTTLLIEITAIITMGDHWPDGTKAEPESVLIMSGEDAPEDTLGPRLEAALAHRKRTRILEMNKRQFSLATDLPKLEAMIEEFRFGCVIIDPLYDFVGGKIDTNRENEMRRLLWPLAELADRHSTAIIVVIHLNKNSDAPALDRITGSRGIGAKVRAIYGVAIDPDDPDQGSVFVRMKNNLAQRKLPGWKFRLREHRIATGITAPRVDWGGADDRSMDELLTARGRGSPKRDSAAAFLRQLLAEGRQPVNEIRNAVKQAGIGSWRTIETARKEIGVVVKREGFGRDGEWFWELPEE